MEVSLRRYSSMLAISAKGVILFGVWSVIKAILNVTLGAEQLKGQFESINLMDESHYGAVVVFIFVIMGVDCLFRLFVGKRAYATAKGMSSKPYLICAILLALGVMGEFAYEIADIPAHTLSSLDKIANLVVEASSLAASCELLYASFKVKRLRKKMDLV